MEGGALVDDFLVPIGGHGPIDANNAAHYEQVEAAAAAASVKCQEVSSVPAPVQDDTLTTWWIAPKKGQGFKDVYSEALPKPMQSLIIGTNGRFAFAFTAANNKDDTSFSPEDIYDKTKQYDTFERAAIQDKLYAAYAAQNPCFAYKWATTQFERNAMALSTAFSVEHELFVKSDAETKMAIVQSMIRVDLTMVKPLTAFSKQLSEQLRRLPAKVEGNQEQLRRIKMQIRPGGTVNIAASSVSLPPQAGGAVEENHTASVSPPPPAGGKGDTFSLLLCKVPTGKATAWKQNGADYIFTCEPKTVPVACFNETHLIVLYQLPQKACVQVRHFELEPQDGSGHFIKAQHSLDFVFEFPVEFGRRGLFSATLSATDGRLVVCFGTGVVLFPPAPCGGGERTFYRLVSVTDARMVTCATLVDTTLMIGTDKGECFTINTATSEITNVETTAAIEPLFSIHATQEVKHRCILHSVMNFSGRLSTRTDMPNVVVELRRPVALDSSGSLIFALTKYGFMNVIHSDMRNVSRIFEPPQEIYEVPQLQHAYKGIKAYKDRVVCVYQNGTIRNLLLQQISQEICIK
jgi:hypothetical protein